MPTQLLDAGGVGFIIQRYFQKPSVVSFPSAVQNPNMLSYDYSPMDNYSESSRALSPATFDFPGNTKLEGMFLGNVNFSRVSIDIRATTQTGSRIDTNVVTDISIDSRDGLRKRWIIFSTQQREGIIRQIVVTPLISAFAGTVTRIGAAVFARRIEVFPQRPRQGLTEIAESDYIRTGAFAYSTGSPRISSSMSFRGSYANQAEYQDFLRASAGELLVVIESKLHGHAVEEQQYAYFARRKQRAQMSRGVAFELSLEFEGEV